MNVRETASNAAIAFLAQGISMLLSVIQSLIVPRLFGVEEFGYWQLFVFYVGYVGFFHFGLNDGIYLLKGGEYRDCIDKASVKSQFVVSIVFESVLALLIVLATLSFEVNPSRQFVLVWTSVCLLLQNAASYLMYVLQAMNETKLSSYSTIVARASFFIPLVILILFGNESFQPLVVSYSLSVALQLSYCLWHCRDIFSARFKGWEVAIEESMASVRVGSKLMVANIASQLVLGALRFSIDAKWGIETFGKLALALSLVNFFLAFVTQAAMVLFPALRQSSKDEVRRFYLAARNTLGLVFPAIYLLYFPMVWLLGIWLPAYADSLWYFALLIPICVFDSKMNITCTTLFKVRRQEGLLLKINLITMATCMTLVILGVFVINSLEFAVACTTLSIIGRSVVSERLVTRDLEVNYDNVVVFEIALTMAFIALVLLAPPVIAFAVYILLYSLYLKSHGQQVLELLDAVSAR